MVSENKKAISTLRLIIGNRARICTVRARLSPLPASERDRGYDFDHQGSDEEANVVAIVQPFAQSPESELDWQRREETVLSRSGSV